MGAVLLILASTSRAEVPPPENQNPRATDQQKPSSRAAHDRSPSRLDFLTQRVVSGKNSAPAHQPENSSKENNWFYSFLYEIKITDVLVALFTGFLVYYTRGLDLSTQGMLIEANRQARLTRKSVRIAKTNAEAAIKSAEVAARTVSSIDRTSEMHLRAYIGIESVSMIINPEYFDLVYYVKNYGQTPAHNVKFSCYGSINEGFCDRPYADPDEISEGVVHWPGHIKQVHQKIERIATKGAVSHQNIYVRDCIDVEYVDAFGKKHKSSFMHERTGNVSGQSIVRKAESD